MSLLSTAFFVDDYIKYLLCNRFPGKGLTEVKDIVYDEEHPDTGKLDIIYDEKQRGKLTEGKFPVFFNIHGGGWIEGDKKMRRGYCQHMARTGAFTVNISYGLGPKYRFPDYMKQVYKALQWVVANADKYGLDLDNFVISGDSAGGHLAAVAALARPKTVRGAILIYPALDLTAKRRPSRSLFAKGFCLNGDLMDKFTAAYIPSEEQRATPEASPILADKSNFPDALIISSRCDILRDEAEEFARSLDAAKRNVRYVCVEGATHLFITQKGMDKAYARALAEISEFAESAQ